jgi:predicted protein tyrosine phosphatase
MEKEKKRKKIPKKPQHHTVGTVPKSKIVETEAKSIPLTLISMTTYFYALVQALQITFDLIGLVFLFKRVLFLDT